MQNMDETALKSRAESRLTDAQSVASFLESTPIDTDSAAQWAVDVAHQLRAQRKELEAERDSVLRPLNDAVRRIRGWFRAPVTVLDAAEQTIKSKVLAFRAEQKREQMRALAAAATSHAELAQATEATTAKPDGMSEREVWSAEIVDASALPREYLVPDQKRLDQLAREQKSALSIPGVRPVSKKILVLR